MADVLGSVVGASFFDVDVDVLAQSTQQRSQLPASSLLPVDSSRRQQKFENQFVLRQNNYGLPSNYVYVGLYLSPV